MTRAAGIVLRTGGGPGRVRYPAVPSNGVDPLQGGGLVEVILADGVSRGGANMSKVPGILTSD